MDFSLFGPYGRRALKKVALTAFTYQVETGTWRRVEMPGPPDFDTWRKSWQVLKTTLLLLKAVTAERLEQHGEFIRNLSATYGEKSWYIVYQADVRFRSEEMERLRRAQQIKHDGLSDEARKGSPFDPDSRWDWVFGATRGDVGRDFWEEEVHRKALLYLTQLRSREQTTDDGTTLADSVPDEGSDFGGGLRGHKRKAGKYRKRGGSKKARNDTKDAREVCQNFTLGKCQDPCPWGRKHVHSPKDGKGGKGKGGKGSKGKGKGH